MKKRVGACLSYRLNNGDTLFQHSNTALIAAGQIAGVLLPPCDYRTGMFERRQEKAVSPLMTVRGIVRFFRCSPQFFGDFPGRQVDFDLIEPSRSERLPPFLET